MRVMYMLQNSYDEASIRVVGKGKVKHIACITYLGNEHFLFPSGLPGLYR